MRCSHDCMAVGDSSSKCVHLKTKTKFICTYLLHFSKCLMSQCIKHFGAPAGLVGIWRQFYFVRVSLSNFIGDAIKGHTQKKSCQQCDADKWCARLVGIESSFNICPCFSIKFYWGCNRRSHTHKILPCPPCDTWQ